MAFYANAFAGLCFFSAVFFKTQPAHLALQWLGGLALLGAVILLAVRK
jgi:hypothetical protein